MPAKVVVVHDDQELLDRLTEALENAGHDVAAFSDPMLALDVLEAARTVEVLVTRIGFPEGKPNGISIALMTKSKRPSIKVLFVAREELEEHTAGVGEFMARPISVPGVVAAVERLLKVAD